MSDFSKDYSLYDNDNQYNETSMSEYTKDNIQFMLTILLFLSFCSSFIHIFDNCIRKCKHRLKLSTYKIVSDDNLLLDECPICLESYKINDKVINLECRHSFHKKCIYIWLNKNNTCPQCRENII